MAEFALRCAGSSTRSSWQRAGQCNAQTGAGDPYRPFRDMLGMLTGDLEAGWLAEELTPSTGAADMDLDPRYHPCSGIILAPTW